MGQLIRANRASVYSEDMGRNAEDITQELKQRFTQIWRLNGAYDPETLAALTYYVAVLLEYRNELKPSALPAAATSIADLVAELRHDLCCPNKKRRDSSGHGPI